MGDSSRLSPDHVVAFVHASEQDVAEVNRPDPVVDFLEADRMLLKRVGEEEQPLLQANHACIGDALDEEVAEILAHRLEWGSARHRFIGTPHMHSTKTIVKDGPAATRPSTPARPTIHLPAP